MCVLLLAIAHRWAGASRAGAARIWVVLVAGHYLDVTAPGLYGREFNLYWDSQHLGNVTAMLARAAPLWLIVLAAVPARRRRRAGVRDRAAGAAVAAAAMELPMARRALGA